MKKVLQFLAMPLIIALQIAICCLLFAFGNGVGITFILPIALIIYMFLGGYAVSKIESKKIKISSSVFTAVLLVLSFVILFAVSGYSDSTGFIVPLISPISNGVSVLFVSSGIIEYLSLPYMIITTIGAVIPVLIILISYKIFNTENKKIKAALLAVMALICVVEIGFGIKGAVSLYEDSYVGEDGQLYNAYYDVNGNKYDDNADVPYYDTQGNVYYWTYDESIDPYSDENFLYCGELTDEQGNEYDIDKVYVNSDGYIYIDENDELMYRGDIPDDADTDWCYKDKDGNIYSSILGVSYMNDGTPYTGMGNEYRNK